MSSEARTTHMHIKTRLGALAVRVTGEGPVTVLWPSMFVDGHTWDRMLPLLPDRKLIVVDGPGLGASAPLKARSSISEAADAAVDLLAGLEGRKVLTATEGLDWIGNALGGHIGYQLAVRPGLLRSFVSVSAPVEPIAPELRTKIRMLHPLLRTVGPVGPVQAAILDAMLTNASRANPSILAVVTDSLERPTRRSLSLALQSFILDRTDVSDLLPRMEIPCLFVASDDRGDWSPADAQRSAEAAPFARAVTIVGSRTLVPLERPTELALEVQRFWADVTSSR